MSVALSSAPVRRGDAALARRLGKAVRGDVLFDAFTRGRYATDASIYQVEPIGVVIPRDEADVAAALAIAREEGVPVLPRGGGTSQCGQTVNRALVIDHSRHLRELVSLDADGLTAWVRPGITLDGLNKLLKPKGLMFPVDISTGDRATIGGMTGNNSCGSRSVRYGNMVHNVRSIAAILPDGTEALFGPAGSNQSENLPPRYVDLAERMRALGRREAEEIAARFPKLLRKVGGYNIDMILGDMHPATLPPLFTPTPGGNLAHLLVGSEGTLAWFQRIELHLKRIPPHKVLGVCHFPTFYKAMAATKAIVDLGPAAVELVDRTMIDLSRAIPAYCDITARFVRGEPDAILLVEFAGEDHDAQLRDLARLVELMGDLGLPDSVVEATDPRFQAEIWEVRKAGLNIMMSMKGDGKPVSFIEDCAVPLEDLADYTDRLTRVFEKHGTRGTWYAHASVGTLHVRPIINLKEEEGARKMRAIAEEAFAIVREYKGTHSGEHGDGIVRSEFHESMFGSRIQRAFEEVKDSFDPENRFNPGRVVRAPRMDDRSLMRYPPGYRALPLKTVLDWSEWGGFAAAVEMCNNNGQCRKADLGVMCPSYRVTGDEKHVTRGRANTLRLAITGQLGPEALTSDAMAETMDLCVGCKGCKRECPTGVDMAKMKIEFQHHYAARHGLRLKDRLIGHLPRYAPWAQRFGWLLNLRNRIGPLAVLGEKLLGFARARSLPAWRRDPFRPAAGTVPGSNGREVVLLVDTFNTWFEPENARAALAVLRAAGYTVHLPRRSAERPLCCGRTFLSVGLTDKAREEARAMLAALAPYVARGVPVVGLEPSCLLTLRDEFRSLLPGPETEALAGQALLFEEFLAREKPELALKPLAQKKALLHGHCHQKAFGVMGAVEQVLRLVPELEVSTVESSCCGMAGAFGYEAGHQEASRAMAELSLLPAVRKAAADTLVVADGTSCRHQIHDGAAREAIHVARVLEMALAGGRA